MYLRAFASAARRICRFDGAAGCFGFDWTKARLGGFGLVITGGARLGFGLIGLYPTACIVAILLGWRRLRFTGSTHQGIRASASRAASCSR